MNDHHNMEETLWNYIDGSLDVAGSSFVEELLQTNAEWRAKYAELMEVHQLVQDHVELDQPSMRFTQNVMEEISRLYITPATRQYINKNVIWGIGAFFLLTIVGLIVYSLGQVDWSQPASGLLPTEQLNWSLLFNNTYMNVFIMVNIILGLMLLDMSLRRKRDERLKNLR